ncbi:hypothetical protein BT96DRAFT_1022786, partial [Gymnopus androsaceus JB14]
MARLRRSKAGSWGGEARDARRPYLKRRKAWEKAVRNFFRNFSRIGAKMDESTSSSTGSSKETRFSNWAKLPIYVAGCRSGISTAKPRQNMVGGVLGTERNTHRSASAYRSRGVLRTTSPVYV